MKVYIAYDQYYEAKIGVFATLEDAEAYWLDLYRPSDGICNGVEEWDVAEPQAVERMATMAAVPTATAGSFAGQRRRDFLTVRVGRSSFRCAARHGEYDTQCGSTAFLAPNADTHPHLYECNLCGTRYEGTPVPGGRGDAE